MMSSPLREPRQKPEDDLSFLTNYYNHYLAIKEKHHRFFAPIEDINDFLKTSTNIASTKFNFFTQLRDSYDYLDEIMGVTFIPAACIGLTIIAFLVAAMKFIHMIAIVVNITDKPDEVNPSQQALEGLILGVTFPLIAVASLIKCTISIITRPLSTLIQGLHEFDDDDENRFLTVCSPPI